MSNILYKNTQQFSVKRAMDPLCPDEAVVQFHNRQEIETFFNNAAKNQANIPSLHRIAEHIAPKYCRRHVNSRPQLTIQERMDYLLMEVGTGNAKVVLKEPALKPIQETKDLQKKQDKNDFFHFLDIREIVNTHLKQLKKAYSKIVPADFSFLETTYQYDENSTGAVPVILDLNSIKEHSTGWKDWDNPFEYGMLGVAKALVVFDLALAMKLGSSKFFAAAAGFILEGVKCQYNITGNSILCRRWYGAFSIRFNLKLWQPEIAWVKYQNSGENERMLFEIKRADRVLKDTNVLYTAPAESIVPFLSGENLISEYKKGIIPPESNVTTPIPLR